MCNFLCCCAANLEIYFFVEWHFVYVMHNVCWAASWVFFLYLFMNTKFVMVSMWWFNMVLGFLCIKLFPMCNVMFVGLLLQFIALLNSGSYKQIEPFYHEPWTNSNHNEKYILLAKIKQVVLPMALKHTPNVPNNGHCKLHICIIWLSQFWVHINKLNHLTTNHEPNPTTI